MLATLVHSDLWSRALRGGIAFSRGSLLIVRHHTFYEAPLLTLAPTTPPQEDKDQL